MHLADAFIQSDLGNTVFVSMCSLGIEPTTFALLTQWCSTTEPQEHLYIFFYSKYETEIRYLLLPVKCHFYLFSAKYDTDCNKAFYNVIPPPPHKKRKTKQQLVFFKERHVQITKIILID